MAVPVLFNTPQVVVVLHVFSLRFVVQYTATVRVEQRLSDFGFIFPQKEMKFKEGKLIAKQIVV